MPSKIFDHALSWVPAEQIEPDALAQIRNTSGMPFIHQHVAVMPDCHLGRGSTVGTCIPTVGAVMPAAVGVDIGCGMIAARTSLTRDQMPDDLSEIRKQIERSIPLSAGHHNKKIRPSAASKIAHLTQLAANNGRLDFYDSTVFSKEARGWRYQLGSLGSGNHFIELTEDEEHRVWAFLHSGSRGIGNKIATYYINRAKVLMKDWHINLPDPDLAYLPSHTDEYKEYITDLMWLQEFALQNRAEMMDRVLDQVRRVIGEFEVEETIECHHNFSQMEHHNGRNVLVTRKGAIQAKEGQMGLIPGSMGTRSYVVRGLGNPASFETAPHGAGRAMSRSKARKTFTMDDFDRDMAGIEVKRSEAFIDELPGAYKNIDLVMEQSKDLVAIVHEFKQFVNVKGD